MSLHSFRNDAPDGWLAFELSVLRRMKFRSLANPFSGEGLVDLFVKRWDVRVAANDAARWAWVRGQARIENNTVQLTEAEVEAVLEDAYVPRHKLQNPALRRWFDATDAWWFDNVRAGAEQLDGATKRALALHIGIRVGDYARSFDEETRELRQPLSRVFRRLWETEPAPVANSHHNTCSNQEVREFLAAQQADLLFLRLPRSARQRARHAFWAWREEWVRGGDGFWDEFESAHANRLGGRVETKQQYLRHVEELLDTAAHLPRWAIAHVENGFVSVEELAETIRRVRNVGTIYTKDFSELMGARAAIITT